MTSAVSSTIPADDVKVDKADLRANFATIKAEISALQAKFTIGFEAFKSFVSRQEVVLLISQSNKQNLARDMAFGRVSFTPSNN